MRKICAVPLLCVITIVSCIDEDDYYSPIKLQITINGVIEDNHTKLLFVPSDDSTSFHFIWSESDKVSLIIKDNSPYNTNNEFSVTTSETSSPMYGTITKWKDKRDVFAIYPYNKEYSIINHAENPELVISVDNQHVSVTNGSDRIKNGLMVAYLKSVACDSLLNKTLRFEQTKCFIRLSITDIPSTEHVTAFGLEDESSKIPIKWNFSIWGSSYQGLPDSTSSQLYATIHKSLSGIPTITNLAMIPFDYGNSTIGGTGEMSVYVETTSIQGSIKSYKVKNLERINYERNTLYEMSASLKDLTGVHVTTNHQRLK